MLTSRPRREHGQSGYCLERLCFVTVEIVLKSLLREGGQEWVLQEPGKVRAFSNAGEGEEYI